MSRTSDDIRKHLKVRRQKQRAILAMRWRCAQGGLEFEQLDTFYGAIRPYLCVAQFFGIMPLSNIRSRDPQDVKFKVRSIGLAVTGLFLLLGGIKTLVGANILFTAGLNAKNMVGLVFLIVGMVNWLNFVGFARSWSHIMLPWSSVDILMLFPPYKRGKRSLRAKVNVLALSVAILAVGDHMLYYASGYCSYSMHILQCHTNHSRITFELYLEKEFSDIMSIMPFNIFSMCYGFHVPEALWYDIRRDHIRLCELASLVEASMSNIVFVSCANNVYVICNQALAIFTKLRHPINYVYFWYSLIFLLARTSLVFMTASKIHDASLLPLRSLYLVPSDGWNQEVQRFADQLTSEFVGLSGYRLFCLTRKSLFGMLATLVTYELMLLQMDAKSHKGLRCV